MHIPPMKLLEKDLNLESQNRPQEEAEAPPPALSWGDIQRI